MDNDNCKKIKRGIYLISTDDFVIQTKRRE